MNLIRRFVLASALLMVVAPVIGLADDPIPTCWPCTIASSVATVSAAARTDDPIPTCWPCTVASSVTTASTAVRTDDPIPTCWPCTASVNSSRQS